MAREGLRYELATALQKAVVGKEVVHHPNLRVKTNGDFSSVNLTVQPIAASPAAASEAFFYLVLLEPAPLQPDVEGQEHESSVGDDSGVNELVAQFRLELSAKEGEWYTLRIQPYRTTANVIEGAVITFMDISEMKKAREELRQTNELLRLAVVVRDAFDAITVQDLDGRILAWNPGAERMYGWSEAEALAMNTSARIPEGLRPEALADIYQLSQNHVLAPCHTQRLTKDGAIVEVWLTSTALVNEERKMYAVATTERSEAITIDPLTRKVT